MTIALAYGLILLGWFITGAGGYSTGKYHDEPPAVRRILVFTGLALLLLAPIAALL